MKILSLLLISTILTANAHACPGSGIVALSHKGVKVAEINEISGSLSVKEGYSLEFMNSKLSNESNGVDMLDIPGGWKWICDERNGMDNRYRSERAYCHDVKKNQAGEFALFPEYQGVRDFHISLTKTDDRSAFIVFRVNQANIDPNQPMARGLSCGTTVNIN